MRRTVFWLALLAAAGLWTCSLLAQEAWPPYPAAIADPHAIVRGPGRYFAEWKLALLLVVIVAWVKSADWVGQDTDEIGENVGLPGRVWKPVMMFAPFVGLLLAITIPVFLAGWGVFLLSYAVPFVVYVVQRNGRVPSSQKVFTPEHLRHWLAHLGQRDPKAREVKHPWQMGPPVEITAVGPLQGENQQAMIEARQSEAYVPLKTLLADAITRRAERIMLEYTADAVAVRYQIDGVWHNATPKVHPRQPLDRPLGDAMLAALKRICHLKPQERRAKQEGKCRLEFEGNKYDLALSSQGTPTGERAVIHLTLITKHIPTLEDLGMRDKLREQLAGLIGPGQHGLVVFAAMPGDGLSATWRAALRSTDRLMRDFISVEEVHKREPDVENVDVTKYDASKGEKLEELLPKLFLKQPEVVCLPEVASGQAVMQLCQWLQAEDKLGLISLRSKDAIDAIVRLLAMKVPPDVLASSLKGVVYTRLIRRLCETCRQAVQPTPELLQRLGIPPGRVNVLYQERQPLQPGQQRRRGEPEICPDCQGVGYKGRTGLFELLVVDDKLRQAILKQAKPEVMRQIAKAAGNRTLQEEGVLLIALGTTSISELTRVLKT
jgi:type II secretory ATPase GspE/PulE/Tfp pilus assembly ATPase PilB-like protein